MSKEDSFHLGVKAIIQNPEGKILLLQTPDRKIEKAYWDIPGGRVHKNESVENALKREIYEETGLQHVNRIEPFVMTLSTIRIPVTNGDVRLIFSVFLCEVVGDASIRLSAEHIYFEWVECSRAAHLLSETFPSSLTEKLAHHQYSNSR